MVKSREHWQDIIEVYNMALKDLYELEDLELEELESENESLKVENEELKHKISEYR